MRTNESIKAHYEEGHVYTSDGLDEAMAILWALPTQRVSRAPIEVLEIGCGDGRLARDIADLGMSVTAIDYAVKPDLTALGNPLVDFRLGDYREIDRWFDIVVMQGVLEHMDVPHETLKFIAKNFRPNQIITSSPAFLNPRGYIWMALQLLFDAPMSLADLHFILPSQMEKWADDIGYNCEYVSVDQEWGHGDRLIEDFEQRLPKVFNDMGIEADTDKLMKWLKETLPYTNYTDHSGATIVYNLRRK